MTKTSIEWTDRVWNPVTGCSKVSQGCKNCYAETIADRFWGDRKFTDVRCHEDRLEQPLHWRKPSRVFVNSMSDLFHEDVPMSFLNRVFKVMTDCPQHTFQVLTKRPIRMLAYMSQRDTIPPNVWLGVSVEDQATADERIPLLLQTPAAVRWISYEPSLGPLDFSQVIMGDGDHLDTLYNDGEDAGIDWVVCGGESGPHARPMHPDWARSVRDQCIAAGVPFFMKQMGGSRDKGGDMSEWPEDLRVREYPKAVQAYLRTFVDEENYPAVTASIQADLEAYAAEQNRALVEALEKIKALPTKSYWNEGRFYEDSRQSGYKEAARIASDALAAAKD